jgi:flagellar protein FliO/FliZ
MRGLAAALLSICALPGSAAENLGSAPTIAGGLQAILGFAAVLAFMAVAAWALRRFGLARGIRGSPVKIIGGVSVGGRERVLVVEAGDQWIVLGVAPGRVNALATMPRRDNPMSSPSATEEGYFTAWLNRSVASRNGP